MSTDTRPNIRKVADFLRTVEPSKFNMQLFIAHDRRPGASAYECVTAACIAGWAKFYGEQVEGLDLDLWDDCGWGTEDVALRYLRGDDGPSPLADDLRRLFFDYSIKTPDEAADHLEKIAAEHGL